MPLLDVEQIRRLGQALAMGVLDGSLPLPRAQFMSDHIASVMLPAATAAEMANAKPSRQWMHVTETARARLLAVEVATFDTPEPSRAQIVDESGRLIR